MECAAGCTSVRACVSVSVCARPERPGHLRAFKAPGRTDAPKTHCPLYSSAAAKVKFNQVTVGACTRPRRIAVLSGERERSQGKKTVAKSTRCSNENVS